MEKNKRYFPVTLSNGTVVYYEAASGADCSTAKPTTAAMQAAYAANQLQPASTKPAGTHFETLDCSGNPGPGPDPTPLTFNKALFLGNSITHHAPIPPGTISPEHPGWRGGMANWGMDASEAAKDYKHIVTDFLKARNANLQARELADFTWASGNLTTADGPYWEEHYYEIAWPGGYGYLDNVAAWGADLIIWRLAENVKDDTKGFAEAVKMLIDKVTSQNPSATVIITGSTWYADGNQASVTAKLQSVASERNYIYVDMAGIAGARDGYEGHPNDAAMAVIAQRIVEKIPTTTGGGTNPGTGGDGMTEYTPVPWGGEDQKYITNGNLTVGFRQSVGAVICSVIKDGENLANDQQVVHNGVPMPDKGVQIQPASLYLSSEPNNSNFAIGSESTAQDDPGTGAKNTKLNPVQGGDYFLNGSPVIQSAIINDSRGQVFCARIRPLIWGLNNRQGNVLVDQEVSFFNNDTILCKVRTTVEPRGSNWTAPWYRALAQESPCCYVIAPLSTHLTRVAGELKDLRTPSANGVMGPIWYTDVHWLGAHKNNGSGVGITLITPDNAAFNNMQKLSYEGVWSDGASSYINAAPFVNYDSPGVYTNYFLLHVGTYSQLQAALPNLPAANTIVDFKFSDVNHKWGNSDLPAYLVDGKWRVQFGYVHTDQANGSTSTMGSFTAPVRCYPASQIRKLRYRMAISGVTQLYFRWDTPGIPPSHEHRVIVNVSGNGTMQDYDFDVPWSADAGIISTFGLQGVNGGVTQHTGYIDFESCKSI
ncbi:hypothetical protein GCM10028807_57670 [Spirosoma daeguense]